MQKLSFPVFVSFWNQTQNLQTPDIHFKMAQWLQYAWDHQDQHLLLMAFRASGKSTITGLFSAWLLYQNPNLRIMVLAADTILAEKMVRNVKRIIERHPMTSWLKPSRTDQWASDRFTVNRHTELRDPSMLARGITSNLTGTRADMVICDDVEVPNTSDSPEKRAGLRKRLAEIEFILVPGGTQLYIGTPHHYYTIYADKPHRDLGEDRAFLHDFKRLKIPILNAQGLSNWPERFTEHAISIQRDRAGPNQFASQMMCEPVNIANGRLNPDAISIYQHDLFYRQSNRQSQLFLGDTKLVSASAWWDPSFAGAKNDHSVLAIIFSSADGHYYLHHIAYLKIDPHSDIDEATQQCQIIAGLARDFYLPSITVEINGIGRFLPNILRRELANIPYRCAVIECHNRQSKSDRILQSFDAILAGRALSMHHSITQTPFLTEMREWRPSIGSSSRHHDDGLDAVAGALSLEPVRVGPAFQSMNIPSPSPNWRVGASHHRADHAFSVFTPTSKDRTSQHDN